MSLIQLEHCKKIYKQSSETLTILDEVSLEVTAGQTLAILGRSGSGKSTLLSLMAGLDKPSSGRIVVAGAELQKKSQSALAAFRAQHIGIIFQHFHLMGHLSAIENVELPLAILGQKNTKQRALQALDLVGLAERAQHLPSRLSGGECQRVAIARAFVVEPQILLADEPSGNLDQQTGLKVMDLLFEATEKKGMTMVLVTHDKELARRCQRQMHLASGRLHEGIGQ